MFFYPVAVFQCVYRWFLPLLISLFDSVLMFYLLVLCLFLFLCFISGSIFYFWFCVQPLTGAEGQVLRPAVDLLLAGVFH